VCSARRGCHLCDDGAVLVASIKKTLFIHVSVHLSICLSIGGIRTRVVYKYSYISVNTCSQLFGGNNARAPHSLSTTLYSHLYIRLSIGGIRMCVYVYIFISGFCHPPQLALRSKKRKGTALAKHHLIYPSIYLSVYQSHMHMCIDTNFIYTRCRFCYPLHSRLSGPSNARAPS